MNLPTAFGSLFFIRYFVPAALVAFAASPILPPSLRPQLSLDSLGSLGWYVLAIVTVGFILQALQTTYLGFLMGITMPHRYRRFAIRSLQRKLDRSQALLATPILKPEDRAFWANLRASGFVQLFPLVDGKRAVFAPTLMGNVIATLTFFLGDTFKETVNAPDWAGDVTAFLIRAWLALSGESRKELQDWMVLGEAALATSAGFVLLFLTYLVVGLRQWNVATLLLGVGCGVVAHLSYRVSTDQAVVMANAYRAVVTTELDWYRERLAKMTGPI